MAEIDDNNFSASLPDLETDIRTSTFIAVDLEFLGLPSSLDSKSVSLFDSPTERYEKLRNGVRKFPPCQLGLSCFKENGDRFIVKTYYLYLFKRISSKVFSFSVSATTFLSQHNFNFNKFIINGVTYMNKCEIANVKREIVNNIFNYDNVSDNFEKRLQLLKMKILLEANIEEEFQNCETGSADDNDEAERNKQPRKIRLPHPMVIELSSKEKQRDENPSRLRDELSLENDVILWEHALTSVEGTAIIFELEKEFPNFEFQLDNTRTFLYVAETPLIFRSSTNKRQKKSLQNFMTELVGASRLFHCISECKKPLIAHNSLLDFMYIYNYFENELPESYTDWKTAMLQTFPTVLDTKVLAISLKEKLWSQGVSDLSLQTLSNYIESPSCGSLTIDTPVIDADLSQKFTGENCYHNAGYDSFQTGKLFIKLAYLYACTKCTTSPKIEWPFQKILILLNSKIVNRIPIPLIDSEYCFLEGTDPPGQRPDLIHVRKRHRPRLIEYTLKNSNVKNYILDMLSYLLPPIQIQASEFHRLQDDFSRIMGAFRVEMKLDKGDLFIATNTAKSFARVSYYFSSSEDFYLVTGEKSYEQHLTAHRERKNDKNKNGCKFLKIGKISLALLIFFYCLSKFRKKI